MVAISVLAAVVALGYGVPRAIVVVQQERATQEAEVDRVASLVADAVSEREQAGLPVTPDALRDRTRDDEWATYTGPDGTTVETRPGAAAVDGDVVATRATAGGGEVLLVRSGAAVTRAVRDLLRADAVVGAALLALAFAGAHVVERWLGRPFHALADAAAHLGRGDLDVDPPRTGLPEIDAVGDALRRSAADLRRSLERERAFTVHASHELRTPLTAMQLELEDLALQTAGTPEGEQVRRVLAELGRLQDAVGTVLDRGARRSDEREVDVAQTVRAVTARWQAHATCHVRLGHVDEVTVRSSARGVGDALHLLLAYVCATAGGDVTVGVRGVDHAVQVTVADAAGAVGADVFTRLTLDTTDTSGGGEDGSTPEGALRAARAVAEGMGARLTVAPGPSTTFVLTIPRV